VSNDHKVTATLKSGSVTKAQLATSVQTSLGLADTALQPSDITTGSGNGTISVDGTDVSVKGLGSAAYTASTAYDKAGAASAVLGSSNDASTANTVYGAKAAITSLTTTVNSKANDADISTIGKTGNVNDIIQTSGDVIVFNCGSASTVI
jgi:hypothetical protein